MAAKLLLLLAVVFCVGTSDTALQRVLAVEVKTVKTEAQSTTENVSRDGNSKDEAEGEDDDESKPKIKEEVLAQVVELLNDWDFNNPSPEVTSHESEEAGMQEVDLKWMKKSDKAETEEGTPAEILEKGKMTEPGPRATIVTATGSDHKEDKRPRITDKVYLDISIGGEAVGRIVIGVFGEIVPKTAKNFVELAKGTKNVKGNTLHYRGSTFHRVMKYFMIQGGGLPHTPGGTSIYGYAFPDENFQLNHYGSGWVSMANAGPDSNASQFFISSTRLRYLDSRFVVFGKVLEGMEVVRRIEFLATDANDQPILDVLMVDTGILPVSEPFPVNMVDVDPDVTARLHEEL